MAEGYLGTDLSGGQGQYGDTLATGLQDAPESDIARKVMKDVQDDRSMVNAWRGLAKTDFAYYNDHQWDDVDRLRMEQQKRPALVFNRIKCVVNAVSGLERLNRMEVRFVTRAIDSSTDEDMTGDLATEAREAALDLCGGEQQRSRAILDTAIGGMGWVSVSMSYEKDIDGRLALERFDPFEAGWDCNAVAENLSDATHVWRERKIGRKLFKKLWGDAKLGMIDASTSDWDERSVGKYELVTPYYSRQNERANPIVNNWGATSGSIPVIQYQWRDYVPVYRFLDPQNPDQLTELDEKAWTGLQRKYELLGQPAPAAVKQMKPVYKQVHVARGVQLDEEVILPGNYFSLLCITGQYDTETKTWYGIVRPLKDAQNTRNKSISNALNFSITNAKGGVMYKTGAFADPLAAKNQWAQSNAWIEVNDSANIGQDIVPRVPTQTPPELQTFFAVSTAEIAGISGINDDVIGIAQGDTPSPTTAKRVQQALAVLGWFFDAISAHMKTEARVTLEFIREFWTRGQLITVGGHVNGKVIPLFRDGLPLDYELVLDESIKHNPNLKAQIWNDLQQVLPAMMRFGYGQFVLEALKFSPLPAQLVERMQKLAQQSPPQQQGKGRGKQDDPQLLQAKVGKLGAERELTLAKARDVDQTSQLKIAELALDAMGQGAKARHQEALVEHKKRSDALKAFQILKQSMHPPMPQGGGPQR